MAIYYLKFSEDRYFVPLAKYWELDDTSELILADGNELETPIRCYYIVSDEDLGISSEFTLTYADGTIEIINSVKSTEIDNKFYYSCKHHLIKNILVGNANPSPTPTPIECVSSPVTITVESEYIGPGNSIYKYTTSDSDGNGGLFGCINVNRGDTLTILARGEYVELVSHPLKITNYNDQGQEMGPLDGVIRTDTGGQNNDGTYFLTWVVPCDETITKYQYQCENHAHMRGTINVIGECEHTPTPSVTPTPSITPTLIRCVSSPVTITVESEYIGPGNSIYKYTTSDSDGNGGLFGCIDVERGSTLTIFVDGDEPNLISHPLKITNYNDQGQAMAPVDGVVKTDLTSGPTEDHTYALTWVVPCDETITKYQYQCENHAHMRGTINVIGECPTPTPTPTNNEQEPIDDYIYDSMEAVSIIGGPDGNSVVGDNDRSLTTIQGVNGVAGLTLENNIVTLTKTGRYYIKARSNAYRPHKVFTRIRFLSGDYANETFDGISRFAWADEPDEIVSETSVVVDITQTTTFKIQTNVENGGVSGGIDGGATLFVQKLASAGGGSDNSSTTPQFCNIAGLATSQTISHNNGTNINFDGDLTTGSQNWRTYNEDLGINVIEPGEAGYYNVNGSVWIGTTGSTGESMIDVVYAQLYLHKYNKTTKTETLIIRDYRGKATAGGWVHLQPQINANNVHLETDDVLYLRAYIWKYQNLDVKHKFGDNSIATYFQVEKSNAVSSSSGGSSSTFASLTDTPSELSAGKYIKVNDAGDGIEFVDALANGLGSLDVIKSNTNFSGIIPDQIVCKEGAYEHILHLLYVNHNNELWYITEDHGTASSDHRFIQFNDDSIGSFKAKNTVFWLSEMSSNSLKWFVDNNRAIYHGGSSSSGSSSTSNGGIGNLPEVIAQSNFDGILPDRIILTDDTNQVTPYTLSYVKSDYIEYVFSADTINSNLNIRFHNNSSGTIKEKQTGHNLYAEDETLQDIIDNNHAVYLGGGSSNGTSSSSGGIGNLDYIKNQTSFNGILPDAITVIGPGPNYWDKVMHFYDYKKDVGIFYKNTEAGIMFSDNVTGDIETPSGTHSLPSGIDSIQKLIDNGRAIYFGGSSSSGSSSSGGSQLNSNAKFQAKNNFGADLPMYLINNNNICRLYSINSETIWYNLTPVGDSYFGFTNNTNATLRTDAGAYSSAEFNSLQEYIDAGNAVFDNGGSSTTSNGTSDSSSFSAVLPSSSILQKVSTSMSSKSGVGANTTLISLEYTPKVAGSKLICTFNCSYQEKNDSQQYGQFFKNGVGFGSSYYCYTPDAYNRDMVTLISETTVDDLSPMTIDVRTLSSARDNVDYRTLFMSVEEISTTDYVLGSSSSDNSSSASSQNISSSNQDQFKIYDL